MKLYHYLVIGLSALVFEACGDDGKSNGDTNDKSCQCTETEECCGDVCVDLNTDRNHCGKCGVVCGEGQTCKDKKCSGEGGAISCIPKTCDDLKYSCGMIDDECGTLINCGSCKKNQDCEQGVCVDKSESCTPKKCEELKIACGKAEDGCGGTVECGTCGDDLICQDGQCIEKPAECIPKTCEDLNQACGSADNGCGGSLDCGSCGDNQTCQDGQCIEKPAECTKTTCEAEGKNCGSISDGCDGTLDCGTCTGTQVCNDNVCTSIKDVYPTRKSIKSLQPDGASIDEIAGNATHGVVMNMVWMNWQPSQHSDCSGEALYDGNCYNISSNIENEIKAYTDKGVVVTAIIWGVPDWARISNCSSYPTVGAHFCAPAPGKEVDYGRFAGFLAHYFNGENGHGRIADFVIHNEVNNYQWFNPGHNSLSSSNLEKQAESYAKSFNAAYDYIRKEQKQAKVLISLDHFFGKQNAGNGSFASRDFLQKLIPKLGDREWRLAYHSYPPSLIEPVFGPNDWRDHDERITFGTLGILAGWLRQNYPDKPYTWEIQLTENGINGYPSSRQSAQKQYLCQAFKNVLGTPGIESFVYHRLIDHPDETKDGLGCGLWDSNKNPKAAWETFAKANRSDVGAGWPACGFEFLPYVEMVRASKNNKHWVTTRQLPSGFNKEHSWKILREKPKEDAVLVYECRVGGAAGDHTMISQYVDCEKQFNMGPMGYLYTKEQPGTSAVYRCRADEFGTHFISSEKDCEGRTFESLMGYAILVE